MKQMAFDYYVLAPPGCISLKCLKEKINKNKLVIKKRFFIDILEFDNSVCVVV